MNNVTAETITDNQIRALLNEAGQAGDTLQIALCNVALGDEDWTDAEWLEVNTCLDSYERRSMAKHTVETAREAVARIIADQG